MTSDGPPNRRTLLCAGFGATAALVSRNSGVATPAQADSCERPPIGGEFICDANALGVAADDFGQLVHKQPHAVYRPRSGADIPGLMRWARSRGLKVAARGQGHSTYGRSMVEGGIVVDMSAIGTIHQVGPDAVLVDAGATWKNVLDATLAKGLTPPVLTNYLELSVGGTIAVGGIGATSSRYGMQTDQVLDMDVVTGDGREVRCSASQSPDVFDAVRGGLGQCGIVARATLRLMRAPERVRRFQIFYGDLRALIRDQRRVLDDGRFDQLQGAILPDGAGGWRYQLDGAVHYRGETVPDDSAVLAGLSDDRSAAVIGDLTYRDDALAFAKLEALLRSKGQWSSPKPWLLAFLPGADAERLAGHILHELTNEDIGPFGRISIYPIRRGAFRTPLVRMPDDDIVFVFNLIRIPASIDAAGLDRMVAHNRRLYDRIRDAGGVQYPVSAVPMSPGDWKDHFGSRWPLLRDAKRSYDPGNLLTPGYDVF